jgi:hypothetical protein
MRAHRLYSSPLAPGVITTPSPTNTRRCVLSRSPEWIRDLGRPTLGRTIPRYSERDRGEYQTLIGPDETRPGRSCSVGGLLAGGALECEKEPLDLSSTSVPAD